MFLLNCLGLFLLLLIASLFSFLETASVAVSEHRLVSLAQTQKWARYALLLKKELEKVLIFSLFGNSFFNALVTTLSTMLVLSAFGSDHQIILSLATLVVTLLIIIFSEAAPKIIASKSPVRVLKILAIPLYYLFLITKPLIWFIDKIVYVITRLIGVGNADGTSLDELKAIIADKRSPFQERHRSILLNSIELEQFTLREVIIPLRNVEMVNLNQDIATIRSQLQQSHHTRIIVYLDKVDNIVGYLHAKDVLTLVNAECRKEDLQALVRKISFVPDFVLLIRHLTQAQKNRERIFVVVNEYGDTLGIACLEDMLEIVFGDFTTDSPHRNYQVIKEAQNSYIVDGATLVREFNEAYQLEIPFAYDAISINGLIIKYLGGIPSSGICFRIDNVCFEVISVGKFWVERARVSILS